ncbi:MAG TPA: hypothetical protein VIX81_06835, partial [Gammaproteobacteria bacterium]
KPAEEPGYRVKIAAPEGTGTPGEIAKVSEEVRALEAVTEQERQKQVELESKIEALRREAAELQDTAKRLNTLMTDMREQVDPGAAATAPDAAAPAAPAPAAPVQLPAAPPAVTPPPTPPAPAPGDEPGDLLGSWVGIVVGLLLFGLLVVWVMLRRRTRQPSQGELEQARAAAAPPAGPSISRKVVPLAKSKSEEAEPAEPAAATAAPELPPMYARQAEEDDEIQVEEVSDLLEQAEIMLLVGDPTEAADVLEKFIEENGGRSAEPRPWLKLLEVLHVTGQRGRFALWSLRFNRRFNIQRPSWEDFEGDRDEEGHMTLELTFPRVTERLIELWPDSGAALAFIEELIINDRPQARLGFARPVADEILMLRDLARYRMMSS